MRVRFILSALGAVFSIAQGVQAQVHRANADISVQILPREEAAEIFILDREELIVPSLKPPTVAGSADYFAIDAIQFNKKPLVLWFKKNPNDYSIFKVQDVELEVQPKFKTNEAMIFKQAGQSVLECEEGKLNAVCIAEPRRGTILKFLGTKLIESIDPIDQVAKWRLYYEVEYNFTNRLGQPSLGKGWISSEDVQARERPAVITPPTVKPPVVVPPVATNRKDIEEIISKLAPRAGECIAAAGRPIRLAVAATSVNPAFNQTLLPYWKKKLEVESPPTFRGQPITNAQMVSIDTLARTIYGEMATCNFSTGPGYLMAVAKVILNRVQEASLSTGKLSQFMCNPAVQSNGACQKLNDPEWIDDITKVVIKPFQFSTWNNDRRADLRRVLCPSGRQREELGKLKTLSAFERTDAENWQDSFRIATEAVLDQENFRKKTADVKATFYVSGSAGIAGYTRIGTFPKIEGQTLDKGRCMKFLRPMTKAEIAAANKAAAARAAARAAAKKAQSAGETK